MSLVNLFAIALLFPTVGLAQSGKEQTSAPSNSTMVPAEGAIDWSTACPVEIQDVAFRRPARYMPAAREASEREPRLELKILNRSGKEIEALDFVGTIRVKKTPYQLDATVVELPLKLSLRNGMRNRESSDEAMALAENAFGFDRLALERVHYTDGTTWTRDKNACVYHASTDLRQLK